MRQAISKLLGLKTSQAPTEPARPQPKMMRSERADNPDNPHTIEDNSDNATRRQLIQMMLRDGLRKHGIPAGWVECRMLVVSSRARGPGLYVRLVMRHWDMRLLTYAHAFQQQLMAAITEFEPEASGWLHGVSWELDVGDSCPYLDMPHPSIWLELSQPQKSAMPVIAALMPASPAEFEPAPRPAFEPVPLPAFEPTTPPAFEPTTPPAAAGAAEVASQPGNDEEADVLKDLERMFAIRDANIRQQSFSDTEPGGFGPTEPGGFGPTELGDFRPTEPSRGP